MTDTRVRVRSLIVFVVLSAIVIALYVGVAGLSGHSGYPLDDAWIHQTYARNWAETGQLAYVVGQPSAGSTSPLWTFLISMAYRLRIDPHIWTLLLGAICLALSAWLLSRIADRMLPQRKIIAWCVGLACLFEWHMIWAAASGMETMLFIAMALLIIERSMAGARSWSMGVFGGLMILTRPEGLVLIGLAALVLLTRSINGGPKEFLITLFAALIVIAPGALINFQASGTFFPNTFYAKQQEYAELMSSATIWLSSIASMIIAPLAGGQVLVLPGLVYWIVKRRSMLRDKSQWPHWLPLVWIGVHISVYALRLPVAYQHGRYLMPIIPIVLLYGIVGSSIALDRRSGSAKSNRWIKLLAPALIGSIAISLIAFVPIGAAAYAADVSIIDAEMVQVAHWLSANTPPDALIAAHDIGAIGYFARRPLIDLAGLISPEVIPFMRDEDRLRQLIEARHASYLVTFPDWYPHLPDALGFVPMFQGSSPFSAQHLTVYVAR